MSIPGYNFWCTMSEAPATEPTDVNLLAGQTPRDFSSFYV